MRLLSDQTISTLSTNVKIQLNTELFDIGNEFDTSTNTFTATTAGQYLVYLQTSPNMNMTGATYYSKIMKNGVQVAANQVELIDGSLEPSVSDFISLNAGGTISFYVWQNRSSSLQLRGDTNRTYAYIMKID